MRQNLRAATLFSLVFAAGAAQASNLVENPDFTDGLTGWSEAGNGTLAIQADDGISDESSLRVTNSGALSSCIVIDDSTGVDLHVSMKGMGGGGGLGWAGVITYSDAACTTPLSGDIYTEAYRLSAEGFGGWLRIGFDNRALPDGTASVQVSLGTQIGSFGAIGDALFDHVLFGPAGTLGDAVPVAQEGLTGTWYNPETSGQGFQVTIDPDVIDGNGSLFGAWFTYGETAGGAGTQRWYSLQATLSPDDTTADVNIYQNLGGNFDAPPATSPVAVGTGSLTFASCDSAMFSYTFANGPTGTIPLRRLLPNVECGGTGTPAPNDFGLSGTWYDPATSGQGILAEVNPLDAHVFVGWYAYSLTHVGDGEPSDQRWVSAQGAYDVGTSEMDLTLYASTNGTFDSDDTAVTTTPVGLATLTFLTCTTATLDYAFTDGEFAGQVDSIDLVRLGAAPASCPLDP